MSEDRITVKVLPHQVHLTLKDYETLFGANVADKIYNSPIKDITPTEYYVKLTAPGGEIENIPVYFPLMKRISEVRVTLGDSKILGLDPPICECPLSRETLGIKVTGSKGTKNMSSGLFIPQRRIYLHPGKAANPHLRDRDIVFAAPYLKYNETKVNGSRLVLFGDVLIKYSTDYSQGFYIDQEEASAANLSDGDSVRILGKPREPEYRKDRYLEKRKRLITETDVRQAYLRGEKITVEPWMMITPAARDLGREKNILIEK